MRNSFFVPTILFLSITSLATADKPKQITVEHLKSLSIGTGKVRDYFDNVHLYNEAARQVFEYAERLEGTELVWDVLVLKVTQTAIGCCHCSQVEFHFHCCCWFIGLRIVRSPNLGNDAPSHNGGSSIVNAGRPTGTPKAPI